ncbi:tail fiber domain-containing protein [Enterobacter mori]|uniref:tail fiber domain-containing protein n=1 Tax=Enterobacter mori TaxID=539813 RepID=UPI000237BA15|nr:tail fiber domain-containing protein [Enterobacter mori]
MLLKKAVFIAIPLVFSASALADLGAKCCPFSDENLKEDIRPLKGSLDKILQLEGVSYTWKESKSEDVGLIAQNVETVYPELVKTEDGKKQVDYQKLVAPLIEALRE